MKGKVALLIDQDCEDFIKKGNTTIVIQEQEDFLLELMGMKEDGVHQIQQNQQNDEEILEVNLINDAQFYSQISYGAKTVVIGKQYQQFQLPSYDQYQEKLFDSFDIVIAFKDQIQVLEEIQKQKQHHIYFIISNIKQYNNDIEFPLQSRNQFKYQQLECQGKQIALIHYSNYQMRVDDIETLEQINQFSYIRRNMIRLQCLWRELLTQVGKFPKYGA
ncbi:unnamed protein product [Paramecium primaurelia]|uniref:Uncharacterized protein n=1 Tax=Paramecium primaurelia TaxID=5886 RepID=A0A8S1M3U7_PARPR|nr:unnamed protein product [Paramecium primaurelia]